LPARRKVFMIMAAPPKVIARDEQLAGSLLDAPSRVHG
jgi:hypothetical protein